MTTPAKHWSDNLYSKAPAEIFALNIIATFIGLYCIVSGSDLFQSQRKVGLREEGKDENTAEPSQSPRLNAIGLTIAALIALPFTSMALAATISIDAIRLTVTVLKTGFSRFMGLFASKTQKIEHTTDADSLEEEEEQTVVVKTFLKEEQKPEQEQSLAAETTLGDNFPAITPAFHSDSAQQRKYATMTETPAPSLPLTQVLSPIWQPRHKRG